MDELAKWFGVGSFTLLLGGIVGYLLRLFIEQRLKRELEDYKHTLAVLGKRLDYLHQERGKAALSLVRHIKAAKMTVKLLVDPMQLRSVDHEQACKDSHAACTDFHNLIANSSFLFPKPLEDQMLEARSALWRIVDEATSMLQRAKERGRNPFDDQHFRELSKKLRTEFEPLESAMIAEIRILLTSGDDDVRSEAQGASYPRSECATLSGARSNPVR